MSSVQKTQDLSIILSQLNLSRLGVDDREKILNIIENKMSDLLLGPREKFFQALYRLDINEERVAEIVGGRLLSAKKLSKSRALAELILDREIQKFLSRTNS